MNGKRSTVIPAVMAIVIAIAVIGLGMYAGIPIDQTNTNTQLGSAGTTGTTGSTSQGQGQTGTRSQSPSSSSSGSSPGQGAFSVLLTDPPNVPQGVTKVYISYRDLQVHVSEAGNQSGWTTLQTAGSIELLGTVNVSQTISSVKIATGDYNQLRFNISSAQVTFQGQNYTAFVQSAELIIPIHNGIEVNASVPTATIIDISPTVINIGSTATPEFIIKSVATAYPVPSGSVTSDMQQDGDRTSLINDQWWRNLEQNYTENLTINSASLSSTGLQLNVTNSGGNTTTLTLVMVTPVVIALGSHDRDVLPGSIFGGAVFAILPNGTLVPVRIAVPLTGDSGQGNGQADDQSGNQSSISSSVFRTMGLNLIAGSSANLSYTGPIQLGFLGPQADQNLIVAQQQYLVTVIGTQAVASFVVVAT